MTTAAMPTIAPADVHRLLGRHMLADGLDIVFDYEKSHGAWVYDSRKGREYLDFMTFFGSMPVGYNHPRMKDPEFVRVLSRVAQLKPSLADVYTVEYAAFVETLARLALPAHLKYMFFIEGGTLGVENPKLRFPVTPEVEGDVKAAEERALEQARKAFEDNPDDIAAIIIEPIQAEGGDNHFRPEFLQALERLADQSECFFVVDEVQTGVGLTGRMWAHEHFGLTPDALAFGKKMQVCGCLVGPKVDEEPQNVFKVGSRINSTWGGGLTDMVRAARFLEIIEEERLVDNARATGGHLLRGLQAVQAELGGTMTNARGLGLMIAFDLPTAELRKKAQETIIANGLLLLTCGPRSIRFRPPLNLAAREADAALDIVRRSLKAL